MNQRKETGLKRSLSRTWLRLIERKGATKALLQVCVGMVYFRVVFCRIHADRGRSYFHVVVILLFLVLILLIKYPCSLFDENRLYLYEYLEKGGRK